MIISEGLNRSQFASKYLRRALNDKFSNWYNDWGQVTVEITTNKQFL
jgi:hypothetical protein